MFQEGSSHCILLDLSTQRSLMIIAKTVLEECEARNQTELSLRSRKRDGLCILIISMSVAPEELILIKHEDRNQPYLSILVFLAA